jgi:WD40 repeat protein
VVTLRLANLERTGEKHEGEIYSCSFAPDGMFVLSAGWDGQLRLWDVTTGQSLMSLRAGLKPLSCCAVSPDGKQWLSGSMEGMLSFWDTVSHQCLQTFVAHTRPISAIRFSPNGEQLVTTSWDRQVVLRPVGKEREGKVLSGHRDIVAGGCYNQDGSRLLSWSHDGGLNLWEPSLASLMHSLTGHEDRVTAAAIAPDGRWGVSGGRDGSVKVWDLNQGTEVMSVLQVAEIRGLFFLPDGQTVVTVDANGWMVLLSVPALELQSELSTGLKVMCADLAPVGDRIALGCEDGSIALVGLEGFEDMPLIVTATPTLKTKSGFLGRLLGQSQVVTSYTYTCPACQSTIEADALPAQPIPCRQCKRRLRINQRAAQLQGHV